MANMRIERRAVADVPLDHAWACITEAGHIGAWLSHGSAEIDLRPGGTLSLRYPGYDEAFAARVEEVKQPRRFAFRWHAKHHDGAGEITVDNSTLYAIELQPVETGTAVTIVETGFDELTGTPEQITDAHVSNVEGREVNLADLIAHMEASAR